jgi:hypothetical protein
MEAAATLVYQIHINAEWRSTPVVLGQVLTEIQFPPVLAGVKRLMSSRGWRF